MGRKRIFRVNLITHPSGAISYEAYGRVGNAKEPERPRFDTKEEAEAMLEVIKAKHQQAMANRRAVFTSLSDEEVVDAEAALKVLNSHIEGKTLGWAVHKLFETYDPTLNEKDLKEAVEKFKQAKSSLSERQFTDYERLLDRLVEVCNVSEQKLNVHQVTTKHIQQFLDERNLKKAKSKNNVVSNLGAFFRWCSHKNRRYVTKQSIPTDDIERMKPGKPRREIINAEQARILMEYAENFRGGVLVNYIATALFSGIRPDVKGELTKQGLDTKFDELFDLKRGTIEVTEENSKTGDFRDVVIQPALRAFYEAYPFSEFPIVPEIPPTSNAKDRPSRLGYLLKKFREKSPFKVPHDGLRHSFCSYHVKLSGSIAETAQQAGDDESTIRKHYLRRVPDDELEPFWAIRPVKRHS